MRRWFSLANSSITFSALIGISLCTFSKAKSFILSCDVVLLNYIFKRRKTEIERSQEQDVAGNVAANCNAM